MAYTSATFYIDPVGGSDTARTALTTVTVANPSGTITRATKTAHGLVTGAVVDLTLFSAWLNAAFKITVVDADNFDLDATVWQTTADNNGTATPRGGSSKADAWKTLTNGATAARHAAGDTIRFIASPDETLVGDCAWTDLSKTITLPAAVTQNIDDGEAAWTASANVTSTADSAQSKEGTKSSKHVIAAAFTTGLVAYKATGTLDLSAYQQVSFWIFNSLAITAGMLSLRLCSDTAGVTTVNTIAIPAIASTSGWCAVNVDTTAALGSSIQSVALYADTDPGAMTVQFDNIIACKAASAADSLTLHSLLGKVHNRVWAASTAYATNAIRKPTQPNRNGYRYKVTAGGSGNSGASEPTWPLYIGATVTDGALTWTCEGLEDTWYPIQSISGTTVKIDNHTGNAASAGRGYSGETETVATYKREPLLPANVANFQTGDWIANRSGTLGSLVTYSGGWDRTSMATQNGETWMSGQNGNGNGFYNSTATYNLITNINPVRFSAGIYMASGSAHEIRNVHACGNAGLGVQTDNAIQAAMYGVCSVNNGQGGVKGAAGILTGRAITGSNSLGATDNLGLIVGVSHTRVRDVVCRNNTANGCGSYATHAVDCVVTGLQTRNNAGQSLGFGSGFNIDAVFINPTLSEATIINNTTNLGQSQNSVRYAKVHRLNGNKDDNRHYTYYGSIASAIDQRHTASGVAWKYAIQDGTIRTSDFPLIGPVAKIACTANVAVTVKIWTRRDNTNAKGQLFLAGGQVPGVPVDLTVACEPTINTWEQSSALTFTPTETGVVEILFKVWDGAGGSTSNFWVDDLTVT